jgi:FdhD protein
MSAPLVDETVVRLKVNGSEAFEWRCTPADLEALVIGRLFITGMIAHADAVHMTVDVVDEMNVRISARVDARGTVTRSAGTGLSVPSVETFTNLFRQLFSTVDARHESGGMHAAAATDGERIVKQVEDVGRHNTIDKITGMLLLEQLPFGQHGLLTSSRVSGEIAQKTVRAGFAWLASRSIPTTLAVRIAQDAHLPIIARAGAYVY